MNVNCFIVVLRDLAAQALQRAVRIVSQRPWYPSQHWLLVEEVSLVWHLRTVGEIERELTSRSVVMRTLLEPERNSFMMMSLSFCSMSPCYEDSASNSQNIQLIMGLSSCDGHSPAQRQWSPSHAFSQSTSPPFDGCWWKLQPVWWSGFRKDHTMCPTSTPERQRDLSKERINKPQLCH